MKKILSGIQRFHNDKAASYIEPLRKLVKEGQRPTAMLVTCSDSRMLPDIISSVDPGDLFIVRNIGNIIPLGGEPADPGSASTGAAIEYSIEVLGVKHIIIMGHGDCGAMKALEKNEATKLPFLDAWLSNAKPALHRYFVARQSQGGDMADVPHEHPGYDDLSQINVTVQLEHLASYPSVQERIVSGELKLHGWWFDLVNAHVLAYDSSTRTFRPIEDVYSELMIENSRGAEVGKTIAGEPVPA